MKNILIVIILSLIPLTVPAQQLFQTMDEVLIDNSRMELLERSLDQRVTFRGQQPIDTITYFFLSGKSVAIFYEHRLESDEFVIMYSQLSEITNTDPTTFRDEYYKWETESVMYLLSRSTMVVGNATFLRGAFSNGD